MITDFRFLEDYHFLEKIGKDLTTIRIYRENTKKDLNQLDQIATDFLLLPQNNHQLMFKRAVNEFPQYAEYRWNRLTFFL